MSSGRLAIKKEPSKNPREYASATNKESWKESITRHRKNKKGQVDDAKKKERGEEKKFRFYDHQWEVVVSYKTPK